MAMHELQGDALKQAIKEYDAQYCLERTVSYNPPEKHWKIDKKGCIIQQFYRWEINSIVTDEIGEKDDYKKITCIGIVVDYRM